MVTSWQPIGTWSSSRTLPFENFGSSCCFVRNLYVFLCVLFTWVLAHLFLILHLLQLTHYTRIMWLTNDRCSDATIQRKKQMHTNHQIGLGYKASFSFGIFSQPPTIRLFVKYEKNFTFLQHWRKNKDIKRIFMKSTWLFFNKQWLLFFSFWLLM